MSTGNRFGDKSGLKGRVESLVHTIGENYNVKVGLGNKTSTDNKNVVITDPDLLINRGLDMKEAEAVSIYSAGHEGAHNKYSQLNVVHRSLSKLEKQGYDVQRIFELINMVEDTRVDHKVIEERPGFGAMRRVGSRALLKGFCHPGRDSEQNMLKALCATTFDLDMRELNDEWRNQPWWDKVDKLKTIINAARDVKKFKNSAASIKQAVTAYDMLYSKPNSSPGQGLPQEGGERQESASDASDSAEQEEKGKQGSQGHKQENKDDSECTDEKDKSAAGGLGHGSDDVEQGGEGKSPEADDESGDGEDSGQSSDTDDVEQGDSNDSSEDSGEGDSNSDEGNGDSKGEPTPQKSVGECIKEMTRSNGLMDMIDADVKEDMRKEMEEQQTERANIVEGIAKARAADIHSARRQYGLSIITKEEQARMERAYCVDTHEGTKIHVTDGVTFDDHHRASSKTDSIKTRSYAAKCNQALDGQARILEAKLRELLKAAQQPNAYHADNGRITPNRVWMATKCNRREVFSKQDYGSPGGFVVSVLLDASGSQDGRQDKIRNVAYVISQALTKLSIPTRMESFQNIDGVTVLTRHRDFDDSESKNDMVFGYLASGDNRDGHAIRIVGNELLRRLEERKIMIVLSDGQPANRCFIPDTIDSPCITYYKNAIGVDDTAREVRRIRQKGVALMGIYTGAGDPRTMHAEKTMYGKDFAFIEDASDFAHIVGRYLERQIKVDEYV